MFVPFGTGPDGVTDPCNGAVKGGHIIGSHVAPAEYVPSSRHTGLGSPVDDVCVCVCAVFVSRSVKIIWFARGPRRTCSVVHVASSRNTRL